MSLRGLSTHPVWDELRARCPAVGVTLRTRIELAGTASELQQAFAVLQAHDITTPGGVTIRTPAVDATTRHRATWSVPEGDA